MQGRKTGLVAAALMLASCASGIREQIYKADATPISVAQWTKAPPQPLPVRTEDGLSLTGYYWPGDPGDHDVILFFHGRGFRAVMVGERWGRNQSMYEPSSK